MFKKGGRTVAICDHPDSIEFLLAGEAPEQIDAWLALTPPAGQALAERGIDYLVVDDFFDEADLLGNIDDRFDFQVRWAIWVDRYLQERVPQFAQVNFAPAVALFFQIKNFFDRVRVQSYSLGAFLSSYLPAKIIWVSTSQSIMKERHNLDFHYVDKILPVLAKERNIEIVILNLPQMKTSSLIYTCMNKVKQIESIVKKTAKRLLVRLRIRCQGWQLFLKRGKCNILSRLSHKPKLIVMQDTYVIPFILPQLVAAGSHLFYISMKELNRQSKKIIDEEIQASLSKVWQEIKEQPDFWGLLEGWQQGKEIVSPWLEHLWCQFFFEYWQGLQQGREYLKHRKVDGIIVANTIALRPFRVGIGFLHAAQLAGIPVFSALHGTLNGYCLHPMPALVDLPFSDYCFCNGLGVTKYLQQVAERYPIRHGATVAAGSPMIDGIRNGYQPSKAKALRDKLAGSDLRPLVLHIPDFLYYHRRLCGDAVSCMPYFQLQKQIIELFKEFNNICLVYRNFSGEWQEFMPKLVKQGLPDAIIAESNIKLSELIFAVDAIILDYPITPLSEVLITDKPIIVFADKRYYKMVDMAKVLLRKRTTLAETPKEYLAAIRNLLKNNKFEELSSPNKEFQQYYMTYKDDGKAAERVADYILTALDCWK